MAGLDRPIARGEGWTLLDEALRAEVECRLVTRGRTTGLPREITVWFAADPDADRLFMLAGGREASHWVRNVMADGRVTVRIRDRSFDGTARVIAPEEDADRVARDTIAAKYGTKWLKRWLRDSLPVEIRLERGAAV